MGPSSVSLSNTETDNSRQSSALTSAARGGWRGAFVNNWKSKGTSLDGGGAGSDFNPWLIGGLVAAALLGLLIWKHKG